MDYKKRFEEVFKWAKDAHSVAEGMLKEDLEHLFPELVESEDEKIRKNIKIALMSMEDNLADFYSTHRTSQKELLAWLEKQGEKTPVDKIQLGKKYKCIASPRYSTFMIGGIYKPEDKFLCSLMNFCSDCFEPIEDGEQNPAEWSEEDKDKLNRIYSVLGQAADTHAFSTTCRLIGDKECIELQDFLKSLRPQNTWKPSDNELEALRLAAEKDGTCLMGLYEQLKRLKK